MRFALGWLDETDDDDDEDEDEDDEDEDDEEDEEEEEEEEDDEDEGVEDVPVDVAELAMAIEALADMRADSLWLGLP